MSEANVVAIDLPPDVQEGIEAHCFSRVDVEVGGFLLGTIEGTKASIKDFKAALAAESAQTHLTFTHEAWAEILNVMDTDYPGLAIIGWYHTHPGFGCFLSDYDIFIQENFFSAPGQHALVIDPLAGTTAFFTATQGSAQEISTGRTRQRALGVVGAERVEMVSALSNSGGRRRSRVVPVTLAVLAAAAIAGASGWFVGSLQGRDAQQQSSSAALQAAKDREAELASQLQAAEAPEVPAAPAAPAIGDGVVPPAPPGLTAGDEGSFAYTYVVKPGDTFWGIARRYLGAGTRFRELLVANPSLSSASVLIPGQTLTIRLTGTVLGDGSGGE